MFMSATLSSPGIPPAEMPKYTHAPGQQYLLLGPDGIRTEINAGFADLENRRPVGPATVFNGYSITKTFTAIAVLQLAEQGKIALSDTVGNYLPEYRFSRPFTVEQLLTHRAGLANPLPLSWIHLAEEEPVFNAPAFAQRIISKYTRLRYRPGAKTRYSNIGYLILGELIARVSGLKYEDYIRRYIFEKLPAGGYLGFAAPATAGVAVGYHPRRSFSNLLLGFLLDKKRYTRPATPEWLAFQPAYVNGRAYGGIVANARGLAAYLQAVLNGDLFENPATTGRLFARLEPGLGMGWFTGRLGGRSYFCHAGGGGGFYAEIRVYPEIKTASVLLTNRSGFSDERLLDRLDVANAFDLFETVL